MMPHAAPSTADADAPPPDANTPAPDRPRAQALDALRPDTLRIPHAGGVKRIGAGLLLVLAGWMLFSLPLAGLLPAWWLWSARIAGALMIGVGILVAVRRTGITLDRRANSVARWTSYLVVVRRKEIPLAKPSAVGITSKVISKERTHRSVRYEIHVQGCDEPVDLSTSDDYREAWRSARQAADFLGVGVLDDTIGAASFLEAGTLALPLRERAARAASPAPAPPRPADCRVDHAIEGDEVTFTLPVNGVGGVRGMARLFAGGLVSVLAAFGSFFVSLDATWNDLLAALVAITLIAVMYVAIKVVRALTRESVIVSPDRLRVRRRLLANWTVCDLPANEIMDVQAGDLNRVSSDSPMVLPESGVGILVRGADTVCGFGRSLTDDERAWLCAMIRAVISAPAAPETL